MKFIVTGQQKYYSSDFAIEIAGKIQLGAYITGDPYTSSYII